MIFLLWSTILTWMDGSGAYKHLSVFQVNKYLSFTCNKKNIIVGIDFLYETFLK